MFIDTTFFTGPLMIANLTQHAVREAVESAIEQYEPELLSKALGESLYTALKEADEALSSDEELEQRWINLLEGFTYERYSRKDSYKGLQQAIAAYVWYFYNRDIIEQQTPIGIVQGKAENATVVSPAAKLCRVWNECAKNVWQLWDVLTLQSETYPEYVSAERCRRSFGLINQFGI